MNNVDDALNAALSTPRTPKETQVAEASMQKQLDFQAISAARATGDGNLGVGRLQWDLQNLTTGQIQQKYGPELARQVERGLGSVAQQRIADAQVIANRGAGAAAWDTTSGVLSGFAGSLANLGAAGLGLVNEDAGTWAAKKIQTGQQWVQGTQSDAVNLARQRQELDASLARRDNEVEMIREDNAGADPLLSGLKRWGKDVVDSVGSTISDPTTLGQGTAEALGSFVAGGPIAKGLRGLGLLATAGARGAGLGFGATRTALRAVDNLAWPAATAAMEGSGAYTGSVNDVLGTSYEDLEKTSPTFRELTKPVSEGGAGLTQEEARVRVANRSGLLAAAIQAPIAGAVGTMTRFAENPLHVPTLGSAVRNVLVNEPLEEAVQSTTGQVAQNIGARAFADENRNLSEGVGEQTAQGAIYGMTSAGVAQAPGAAVQVPGAVIGSTKKFLADRYNSAVERAENESPIGDAQVKQDAAAIRSNITPITESLQQTVEASGATPEQKAKESAYISTLTNALSLAPEEIAAIPEQMRAKVDTAGRPEAIRSLLKHIKTLEKGTDEFAEAVTAYVNLLEPIKRIQQEETPLLDQIKEGSPEYESFQSIRNLLNRVDKSSGTRQVVEKAGRLLSSEKVAGIVKQFASVESAKTPEGQRAIQQVAALTSLDPTAGTKETNNFLLKHHEAGNVQLTAPQLAAVQASNALIDAHEAFTKEQKAKGLVKAKNFVDEQIVSNSDPLVKKGKYKLSGRQYVNEILQNLMTGNRGYAAEMLEHLGLFAQHMQYKVDALNEHYAAGSAKGNHGLNKIGYTALSPKDFESGERPWYQVPANKGLHVSANSEASVRSAQTINLEAQTINALYNSLRAALPELTTADGKPLPEMTFAPLDPAIADGTVQEVVQRHTTKQPAKPQTVKAQETAPAKQEATPAPETKPAEATPVSRITQEQAQTLSDEDLNKRIEAIQEKRSKKTNTPEDDATFKVLDEEMTRREDEAVREAEAEESEARPELNIWAGTNENRELSNLAPRPFKINGREYFSVEHAYQSLKSGEFDQATYDKYDRKGYKKIPGNKGTKTENGWNIRLMSRLVEQSFAQNPDAAEKLVATGDQVITHTQDRGVWAKEFPRILMEVRQRLQSGELKTQDKATSAQPSKNKQILDKLVEKGKAIIKGGVYYVTDANSTRYMGGTTTDGFVYVNLGKIRADGLEDYLSDSEQKQAVLKAIGVTAKQFASLFPKRDTATYIREVAAFVRDHELSHLKNEDSKSYPQTKEGKPDLMHPDAIAIETRATLDGLTDAQRDRLDAFLAPRKALVVSADPVTEAPVTSTDTSVKSEVAEVPAPFSTPETADVPLPPTFTTMRERFSTLWNATRNYILTKFRPAVGKDGQPVSRLEGVRNPVSWVTVALSDKETLTEVLGKEPKRELTSEVTSAYEGILDQTGKYQFTVGGLLRQMNKNLQQFIKTRKEWLAKGDAQQAISAKQLNLLEESIDEKGNVRYSYNPELIQSAALAAIQWLLSNNNTSRKLEREEYERIAGYESFTEEVIRFIDGGLPKTQIIPALSNMIRQFWGIQPLADADIAHSNAVVDAVAAELLNAMSELDFIEKKQLKLGEKQNYQGEGRTLENFSIKLHKHSEKTLGYSVEALKQFTDLIQTVALTNPEPTRYIDGDIPPVADTQMNNPSVRNTPAQRRAIERAQEASASRVDMPMWHITNAFGRDGITDFLSDMDPSWTEENTNKVHWDTLQAQRLGIQNAFDEVQTTIGEMKNTTSGKSLKDIVVRYAFNFSKVGRLQMLGSYTAQASKFTREVLLPTWSKLNLFDNADHQQAFALAQMQHLDIKLDGKKVHQVDPSLVPAFIEATYANEKVQPLLKAVRDWMKTADLTSEDPSPKSLDGFKMRALMKDAGFAVSTGALHSVVEWVRYKDANEAGQKDFETSLYLEADGVTNGPIMAMLMLTVGKFNKSWMDAVQKGGIYFGASKPFHQLYALNNVDLYRQAAQNMESSYKLRRAVFDKQSDSKKLNALATDMNTVMSVLFGKDFTYNPVDRTVTFDRGFTKNPLTITLYGSGARGIAGNFVDALLEKLYEMSTQRVNSDMPISPEFEDALDRVLTTNIWYDSDSKTYSVRGKAKQVDFWNKEYSATKQEMDALRNNFLYAIVEPMREAISATVGSGVTNGMTSVQQATQVQSVFVQEMYRSEVEALLEKKKSEPGYRKGDFLSPKELREIDAKVVRAFPNITTRAQIFRVAKNAPLPLSGHGDYARALNDTLYVEPDIKAPAEAGVAGVASVNIGFGDANMIQISISDPSMGRSLPVFDGWNMPLDAIAHQSEQLNKAVAEAAMGNPMAAIYRSFQKVLENAGDVTLSKSALASLARTFESDELTQDAAIALVQLLGVRLAQEVKEIDARHKAMKFVGFNVDHMASAGAPYYEGTPNDLTPDQNLELLQAKYEEYLAEPEETANSIAKDAPAAQVYIWDTLKHLVGELKMSGAQKLMYEQVLSAMGAVNYTIVVGTREQIHQYMKDNGEDTTNFDEKTNGLIHNGKIYLANPTGETLTHELIHAATMNAVIAYYNGQDLGPAGALIREAIQNLEPMAEDFMNMQVDPNWSLPVLQAFLNARNSMAQQRANGSQAGFIGEFIAWTTTNTALTKTLKTVQPSRVVHWTRSVLGLIKRVLFGNRKMPEVAEDFLSNVQFNASILVQAQITLPEIHQQITLQHAVADSRLERLRDGFQNWVVRNLKPNPMNRAQVRDVQQSTAAEELANYAGDIFGLGQLEKDTLREVMAALATEASIDPQAMIGIQEMYRLAQESLDPSDFVDENSLNLDADTTKAQWKFQLLMGKRDRFYDTSKRSDLLPLFLGLALVSPEVRGVLAKIEIPGKKKGAKTLDQGLENLASNMMQSLSGRLTSQGNSQNVQQALDNMTENLLRNIAKTKTNMDVVEARTDQALRANEFVKNQLQNLSTAGVKYGKKLETSQNKLTRITGKLIRFSAAMASETEADKAADGILQFASAIDLNNTMMSLAKDLVGRTAAIGNVYDRIKQTRAMTQQMRQNFRDHVPEVILKKFKTKPTAKQMTTMFKGFAMTDLVALSEDTKMLNDLLTDPSKVKARIKELEDSIKSRDPKHWPKINDKSQQLAQFMMTKQSGAALLRNAYAIANLWAVPGIGNRPQPSEAMITEIDQLTSLYALERLSQEERDTLASLVQNETEGVNFMLSYLVGQRKTETVRNKLGNARANHYKGFVPSLSTNGGQIIVRDDANFVDLKHQGYTRIGTYNGHGTTSRGYYYTSTPTQASFAQGMMQNINQTAGGVERSTGFTTSPVANRITDRRTVRSLIGRMQAETRMTENLSPIFNDRGVIIAFEQLMDPTMLQMIEPSTELHKMLGVWRGRQVEELQATKVNMALMDTLKTNYDEADDKGLYVNILDHKNMDRVEADAIRLFSEETLEYAKEVFGENKIMVRRDLIDDVIGYRNFSVSDFWTDNNRFNTDTNKAIRQAMIGFIGSDAYKVLVKSEQFVQGVVSDARTQIVVKSVIVPAINIASNMLHLMQRGVNPIMMAREFPKKLNELNTYIRTYLEQVELEAELRAATKPTHITQIQAKIRSIKDAHRRLTIWPLIEAGEFSSIADIGNSREDLELSSGRLNEWIGKQIDKLPQEARTFAKYGLVTKDTALFQGLQKSVQYGDFLAKAVLYDHMLVKENRTREQALAQLTEEFVNYDRLPGRMRGGMENLGLLWFYNFKLRSLKVGLSILRNNPLHAAMSMVIPTPFGIDTALDANIVVKAMEGALPYSLGPGMGLRSLTLNPWVNLVN